jgi:perosamine synthetase
MCDGINDYLYNGVLNNIADQSYNKEFTDKLVKYVSKCNDKIKLSLCSNGTSALHAILRRLNIKDGQKVICPNVSFASTWNVIRYVGAIPVFVDIDSETWCIDVDKIEDKIDKDVVAIIAVDLYGNMCDYDSLRKVCDKHNLVLISDAAESFGSLYNNKLAGSLADYSIFSFNINKLLTSSGGGAILFDYDRDCAIKRRTFVDNGKIMETEDYFNKLVDQMKVGFDGQYNYYDVGYNYRMNPINAAIGLYNFNNIDYILHSKKTLSNLYKIKVTAIEAMLSAAKIDGDVKVKFQKNTDGCMSNNWLNVIMVSDETTKYNMLSAFNDNDIEARPVFTPASMLSHMREFVNDDDDFKNSTKFYENSLSLPSSVSLGAEEVKLICDIIFDVLS